jgi:plasmid stabilization system protein ParE
MAKTVKWSEVAWASRYYAAAFVREVREAARSLRRFPERGAIVAELGDVSIREIYVRRYRLIYQVSSKRVVVLGFIHGARDLAAIWRRERSARLADTD